MNSLPRAATEQFTNPFRQQGQPFLRWAGSKRKLILRLAPYWPGGSGRYVEPFAGSACLFFRLAPPRALIGDINAELIGTYEQLKHNFPAVLRGIAKLKRGKKAYYQVRSLDPASLARHDRAARFIYLNRYCFNGLYRTNRNGMFNVPYGARKSGRLPGVELLENCSALLSKAELVAGDFEEVLALVGPEDFVYLDPPFSISNRRVFREYGPAAFSTSDLTRLRHWLLRLDKMGSAFLVSYADSREARNLGKDFAIRSVIVQRHIAGFARHRRVTRELLISNRPPSL